MSTRFGGKFYKGIRESDEAFNRHVDMIRGDCKPNERVEIGQDERGIFYRHVYMEDD